MDFRDSKRRLTARDEGSPSDGLAAVIARRKDDLLEAWARRVLADPKVPSALGLTRPALYDHFPALVDRIVATLRMPWRADQNAEDVGKSMEYAIEAQQHIQQRVADEYSVPEVLRELSHLRLAIIELCEHEGEAADAASLVILHAAFDQMMIDAAEELSRIAAEALRKAEQHAHERSSLYELEKTARQASDDANRVKDDFLATVSHELRTPLNAILGWSAILQTRQDDPEARARAIVAIRRNANLQADLVESILDLSRITRGQLGLRKRRIDLRRVVRDAVESMRPQLEARQQQLDLSLPPAAGSVFGDELRLHQVVTNLVGNAVKFTPMGGRLRVHFLPAAGEAVIEVSDSGAGIAPSFLPHVFESFRQADASVTRKHGGLGLGLAIAKSLVELHGGTIEARSAGTGFGATFVVRLPTAEATAAVSDGVSLPDERRSSRLAGIRVVVVDDALDARDLVAAVLEDEGALVRTADGANAGLRVVGELRPHVLVSDYTMPGEDGVTFLRRVRTRYGSVPAIALTAVSDPRALEGLAAAGFERQFTKPAPLPELVYAVEDLAATRRSGEASHA